MLAGGSGEADDGFWRAWMRSLAVATARSAEDAVWKPGEWRGGRRILESVDEVSSGGYCKIGGGRGLETRRAARRATDSAEVSLMQTRWQWWRGRGTNCRLHEEPRYRCVGLRFCLRSTEFVCYFWGGKGVDWYRRCWFGESEVRAFLVEVAFDHGL
jgi:hypothetical protein